MVVARYFAILTLRNLVIKLVSKIGNNLTDELDQLRSVTDFIADLNKHDQGNSTSDVLSSF